MEYSEPKSRNRLNRHRPHRSNSFAVCLASACVLLATTRSIAQQSSVEKEIRELLRDQVAAWNRGDVEGYMRGYWESDSTVFTSGGSLTRGYRQVLLRYKEHYSSREKMGTLEFQDLVLQPLSPTVELVMGVWKLKRASTNPWGRFTLIIEKKPEGWRITHDHTSTAEP